MNKVREHGPLCLKGMPCTDCSVGTKTQRVLSGASDLAWAIILEADWFLCEEHSFKRYRLSGNTFMKCPFCAKRKRSFDAQTHLLPRALPVICELHPDHKWPLRLSNLTGKWVHGDLGWWADCEPMEVK